MSLLITHARLITVPAGTEDAGYIEDGWMLVEDGRIAAIGASLPPVSPPSAPSASPLAADGVTRIDARGALLLPGLVESHTHLDKTVWGMPWYDNECGSRLIDRIDNERRWRAESGHDAGAASLAACGDVEPHAIVFVIAKDGRVTSASAGNRCIEDAIRSWRFPAAAEATRVAYPLTWYVASGT